MGSEVTADGGGLDMGESPSAAPSAAPPALALVVDDEVGDIGDSVDEA